jgi:hypothetical protein
MASSMTVEVIFKTVLYPNMDFPVNLAPYVAKDGVAVVMGADAEANTRTALVLAGLWARARGATYEDGAVTCFNPALSRREERDKYRAVVPCAHLCPSWNHVGLQDLLVQQRRRTAARRTHQAEYSVLVVLHTGSSTAEFFDVPAAQDLVASGRTLGIYTVLVLDNVPSVLPAVLRTATNVFFHVHDATCADRPLQDASWDMARPRIRTLPIYPHRHPAKL